MIKMLCFCIWKVIMAGNGSGLLMYEDREYSTAFNYNINNKHIC